MREKLTFVFKREKSPLEKGKREEIENKMERIENKIEKRSGKRAFPEKVFFEKEPGKKSPQSIWKAAYKETGSKQKAERRVLEYLKEESVLSNKIYSRTEGKKIYLNLKELEKIPLEGLYSVLYSTFIIYPRFEKEILPELEEKAGNLKNLGIEKETLEGQILELGSFIFAENFAEKEMLKKNLQRKLDSFKERKNYISTHKILEKENLESFIKEELVELNCWLEESKILEEEELEKEIRRKINREAKRLASVREGFKEETSQISSQIENLVENFGEKLEKKFLGVDLNYYFPREIHPEDLVKVLEPKIEERPELQWILDKLEGCREIPPELLEDIKANLIITREDIERAEKRK